MTVTEVRAKWNRRYQEQLAEGSGEVPSPAPDGAAGAPSTPTALPEPNPLAERFRDYMRGGTMLDAACGLGRGIAAAIDRVDRIYAVDISDVAVRAARRIWKENPKIRWIVADVNRLAWPDGFFDVVGAFAFTDWAFLRRVSSWVRPGGLFLYQGFSRRQLTVKPDLDPHWTSTPDTIAALFPGWRVLACEESDAPPYRVSFAALKPEPHHGSNA